MCRQTRCVVGIVSSLGLALVSATAAAQATRPATRPSVTVTATEPASVLIRPGGFDPLGFRVNIDVEDANPRELFKSFESVLLERLREANPALADDAARIAVAGGVGGTVTLALRNVSLRTAINVVCESIGCSWTFRGSSDPLRVLVSISPASTGAGPSTQSTASGRGPSGLEEPVQVQLEKAEAATVFAVLARITGYRVELSSELATRPIRLEMKASLREVLDAACGQVGCVWSADGDTLTISPR